MMNANTNFTQPGFYGFPYQGPIQGGGLYSSTLNPGTGYPLVPSTNSQKGMPPVQSFQLSNGSRGICQQMPQTEIAEVTLQLPLGAGNAAARLLLKEALLKGSLATKDFLQEKAGQNILVAASPGGEKLLVNLLGPSGKEGEMLQLALQLTKNPILDPASFRALKEDLLQNLKKGLTNPEIGLNDRLRQEFYGPQHPYGKTLPQLIQEVEGMGLETLQAYLYQAVQQTQQATMMMISPLPPEAQVGMMQNCIAQNQWYPNPYGTGLPPIPSTPPVQWSAKPDKPVLLPNESADRASIQKMWKAPSLQDPDYPAFLIITKMLGGMSGGFFKVLRTEKGLVYGTQQGLENHPFGSLYLVNAEIDLDKDKIK
ncbi:MAG: insulinase family protein, partial [Cyanobacteria bacterium]|nr:insulinase family protein [Cyanobacteriota bacterium]